MTNPHFDIIGTFVGALETLRAAQVAFNQAAAQIARLPAAPSDQAKRKRDLLLNNALYIAASADYQRELIAGLLRTYAETLDLDPEAALIDARCIVELRQAEIVRPSYSVTDAARLLKLTEDAIDLRLLAGVFYKRDNWEIPTWQIVRYLVQHLTAEQLTERWRQAEEGDECELYEIAHVIRHGTDTATSVPRSTATGTATRTLYTGYIKTYEQRVLTFSSYDRNAVVRWLRDEMPDHILKAMVYNEKPEDGLVIALPDDLALVEEAITQVLYDHNVTGSYLECGINTQVLE